MNAGTFKAGVDPRRGKSACRPPSARTVSATIRGTLGRDVTGLCEQVRQLAATGDPAGLLAAAILVAGVAAPGASAAEAQTVQQLPAGGE